MKFILPLFPLAASTAFAATTLYNFDLARNRGGVESNASNDDSNLVFNTAAPSGTSAMTWNVTNTGLGNLTNATVSKNDLAGSTGTASTIDLAITSVNTDGYSDQTPKDGVWTSYMTTVAQNGTGPTITLSGLSPGDVVNLVLYNGNARWSGATIADYTFGGVTKQAAESLASNTMPLTDGVTYVRFDGLVADVDGRISGTFGTPAGIGTATLAGLQFEVVPEPSAAVLGLLGSLALLRRRRN
jgi:hypothetical protein